MKNKKSTLTKISTAILMTAVMLLGACKKDKYQPKGDYQPAGNYGNANITSSTTVTLNNWSSEFDDGINFLYSTSVSWSAVTADVMNKGIVMVYADDGAGKWLALPYTDAGNSYYSLTYNFAISVGNVRIEATGFDDTGSPTASALNGMIVRMVAISAAARIAHPDVDLNDYAQVQRVFELKD